MIDSVTENFGAEEAGLQKGDVILAADGIGVSTNTDLLGRSPDPHRGRERRAHYPA